METEDRNMEKGNIKTDAVKIWSSVFESAYITLPIFS